MQRPVRLGQLWRSHLLSREEAAYMQAMAREHFEDIMAVLKALPRPMLLVLRNINTVRAINTSLGAPVDRYFLMAKRWGRRGRGGAQQGAGGAGRAPLTGCAPGSAVKGWSRRAGSVYRSVYGTSLLRHIRVIWETFKFEVALR